MQQRRLGRTGLQVSVLGFGAAVMRAIPSDEATALLTYALDHGITYFDTAPGYGDSEVKLGSLAARRDEYILATKIDPPFTRHAAEQSITRSLQRLRTDHVDIVQLHGIGDTATLRAAMGPEGAFPAMRAAQATGQVHYLGISSHDPAFLRTVIEDARFDMVLTPFNSLYQDAAQHLFPRARELDIGVVVMKPFASGALTTPTPATQHLFQDTSSQDRAAAALRFILPYDIATIVPGTTSIQELQTDLAALEPGHSSTPQEHANLTSFSEQIGRFFCRAGIGAACAQCLPCPLGIPLPQLFGRYHRAYLRHDPLRQYQQMYRQAFHDARDQIEHCNQCGDCDARCPYGLPVSTMLAHAAAHAIRPS
jgi:predicted aldo/keto reductase-like oxidoreductase